MKHRSLFFIFFVMAVILTACSGKKEKLQATVNPMEAPVLSQPTADVPSEEKAVLSDSIAAVTEEPKPGEENLGAFRVKSVDGVISIPSFGIEVTMPESVRDFPAAAAGMVMEHFAYANFYLVQEDDPDDSQLSFLMIYAYPDKLDQEGMMEQIGFNGDIVIELGSNEALYYYGLRSDKIASAMPESFEEIYSIMTTESQVESYKALIAASPDILQCVEILDLILPKLPKASELASSEIMDYIIPDLDGNDVRLGDMINKNKVTMLNVWGIDCGPCILEMPSLMKLYRKYQDQGFMIIGLTSDIMNMSGGIDPQLAEDAKGIIAELKVEYPILAMTRDNYDQMHIVGTPTTYFVDSAGSIIGSPVLGSKTESEWEKLITDALTAAS